MNTRKLLIALAMTILAATTANANVNGENKWRIKAV